MLVKGHQVQRALYIIFLELLSLLCKHMTGKTSFLKYLQLAPVFPHFLHLNNSEMKMKINLECDHSMLRTADVD